MFVERLEDVTEAWKLLVRLVCKFIPWVVLHLTLGKGLVASAIRQNIVEAQDAEENPLKNDANDAGDEH